MATNPGMDPNDLNQDSKVTKEEIDKVAGQSPGYYSKKAEGSGFLGGVTNFVGNVTRTIPMPTTIGYGISNRQGRKDDWTARRDELYKKYGIGTGAVAAPGVAPTGAQGTAPTDKNKAKYPDALLGTYGGSRTPVNKSPFPTLGVTQGLIDAGIVREQMDPTGDIVYVTPRRGGESVVMQYKAQDAYMHLADMDDEQLGNFRRAMHISGYGTPSIWAGPLNTSDVDLMVQAMTDANMSGGTWDEVVNRRVEAGGRYARPLTMYEAAINSGDTASVLQQYAKRNAFTLSDSFIANQQRAVADGDIEIEDLLTLLKETYVKTLYPAFSNEVDRGLTIEDLAGPWRAYLAETFQVPEDQISLFDPLMQAALQNFGPDGKPTKTQMNDFADMVQADPRWEYTPDAWRKIGMAQDQLAAQFGAANQYQAPTVGYSGGYRG